MTSALFPTAIAHPRIIPHLSHVTGYSTCIPQAYLYSTAIIQDIWYILSYKYQPPVFDLEVTRWLIFNELCYCVL